MKLSVENLFLSKQLKMNLIHARNNRRISDKFDELKSNFPDGCTLKEAIFVDYDIEVKTRILEHADRSDHFSVLGGLNAFLECKNCHQIPRQGDKYSICFGCLELVHEQCKGGNNNCCYCGSHDLVRPRYLQTIFYNNIYGFEIRCRDCPKVNLVIKSLVYT